MLVQFFPEKIIGVGKESAVVGDTTPPNVHHSKHVRRRSVDLEVGELQNLRVAPSGQDAASIIPDTGGKGFCGRCCKNVLSLASGAVSYITGGTKKNTVQAQNTNALG